MTSEPTSIPERYITSERDYLRKLWTDYAKETSDLERYALTLAGVVWSWAIANSTAHGIKALFFLPILTTLLFGLRAYAVFQIRMTIRTYLAELHPVMGLPTTFGWEHYLRGHGHTLRIGTGYAFWAVLQIVTIVVGVVAWKMLP